MTRLQQKPRYGYVLLNLFNDEVGNPIDLVIGKTFIGGDMIDLPRKPRLKLEQMSTKK